MQTNTYQAVIVTDAIHSYYIFTFICGDIQWSGLGFETAIVGYNSNGDYFSNHPANGFPEIGEIVSCTRRIVFRRRRKRQQIENDGSLVNEMPANEEIQMNINICLNLDLPEINMIRDGNGDIVNLLNVLPRCPRLQNEVNRRTEFVVFEEGNDCFRSTPSFTPNFERNPQFVETVEFVSVCCYDNSG